MTMASSPTSPTAHAAQETPDKPYYPGQPKSIVGIATRSFLLGVSLSLFTLTTVLLLIYTQTPLWRLPFFLTVLSAFHFLEFWTTAAYNTPAATTDAFLLTANWPAYAIAHASASLECLLTNLVFSSRSWAPYHSGTLLLLLGLVLILVGQVVRSAAMIQCGTSFNHLVQHKKATNHTLVTTGIYGRLRHPSYWGYFWWALGTQLVLGNVVCFAAYAIVLWRFFSSRIRGEEDLLQAFFGQEYVAYRTRVGTWIPFVR